jgi:hypothetical protein
MESSGREWPRAARLDARGAVEALRWETGVRLTVEGPCPGGEVGAVTLRFGVHGPGTDPAVPRRLDAALDALPEAVLRAAWAHMSLRMVDWAVRHFGASDVEGWLDLAGRRMD